MSRRAIGKKGIITSLYLRDDEEACQMEVRFIVGKVRDKSGGVGDRVTSYKGLESKKLKTELFELIVSKKFGIKMAFLIFLLLFIIKRNICFKMFETFV